MHPGGFPATVSTTLRLARRVRSLRYVPHLSKLTLRQSHDAADTSTLSIANSALSLSSSPTAVAAQAAQTQWQDNHKRSPITASALSSSLPFGQNHLPISCPGCGALSHQTDPREPGFYTKSRKAVRAYFKPKQQTQLPENATVETEIDGGSGDNSTPETSTDEPIESITPPPAEKNALTPVCDRCHDLRYNFRGMPIAHPSLRDIADSIAESPFSRNHVYHVLDAADFPMSLEPRIFSHLTLAKPRTQNRRSKSNFPYRPTVSFIISRSDLLGPTKEKVDSLMPYFKSVLRTAIGRRGEKMRLGDVHLVSAKRGWWTKEIKDAIWTRGGGNWMVGKFNVGKSNLFEVLFPKGSGERAGVYAALSKEQTTLSVSSERELLSETTLLPPPQPETPFPALPLVSNLPGTTASPIRLPFGNHKGELIDLPGLERGNLSEYVHPDHKLDLVMTSRPKVSAYTIRPGQSLLLGGGLLRITPLLDPNDPSTTMMAYPFVPLDAHVTSTEKAIGEQQQSRESGIKSILATSVGDKFASAGKTILDTDVTKHHAGPLLRAGVSIDRLPFRVYSTDLLIQGVGWLELVCQTRRRRREGSSSPQSATPILPKIPNLFDDVSDGEQVTFKPYSSSTESPPTPPEDTLNYPAVEVFTPEGKHISKRIPLGAWTLWREGNPKIKRMVTSIRPRRPMKGAKKMAKAKARLSGVAS